MLTRILMISGLLISFSAQSDPDFCTTASRFGKSMYELKTESEVDREFYIKNSLVASSLSGKDATLFYRYLSKLNREISQLPVEMPDIDGFLYKKCAMESLAAIETIGRIDSLCRDRAEFASYAYEQKVTGTSLIELMQKDPSPTKSGVISIMNKIAYQTYHGNYRNEKEAAKAEYESCLLD